MKNNITASLIGALTATFPTVTSVMMYNYVADGYAFAFLMSCLAAFFLTKKKVSCIVVSVVLIALSSGIYQAYITVTIMLLLLYLILEIIHNDADIKNILLNCLKFFATGVAGMVLYYIAMNVLLKLKSTALLDYQGFDSAASLESLDIAGSLYTIKESFVGYFFDFSNGINLFCVINVVIFAVTVLLYVADIIRNKLSIPKILMLVVFVVFLPIGASVLSFINSGIDYHNLMKMGFLVFYLFFVLQYEKSSFKNEKINCIKLWTILSVTTLLVCNNVIVANVAYHKLNIAYEKSYGTLIRIADRIEQTEGADECGRILVVGYLDGSEGYSAYLPPDITGTTDGYILRADDEMVGQSVVCSALNDYCAKDYKFVYGEEKKAILENDDVRNLVAWPDKNSICIVDDVIVVKLGNQV